MELVPVLTATRRPFASSVSTTKATLATGCAAIAVCALKNISRTKIRLTYMQILVQKVIESRLPCLPVYLALTKAKMKQGIMATMFRNALKAMLPTMIP